MVLEEEAAFFLVHVEPEMAELAVLQRAAQRIAFDKAAAPGIDRHRAMLHFRLTARHAGGSVYRPIGVMTSARDAQSENHIGIY
ncbi:hypothetical protein AYM40_02720 [Paraburkholderia phytofirmans OLGA172]|uniref:Uncharacterized protein n=1 Tax=Paraburkholderia phytofirmans OLGA172 TaxID=1417228 RepID=A0A160FH10_9BURK|nr:hypothetical protein AYM40_02720 [Paraburkholderia phytofirmans OLGA172]